jgi:hypothetical protein
MEDKVNELKNIINNENTTFEDLCNILRNPVYEWVWNLKKYNRIEFCCIVVIAAIRLLQNEYEKIMTTRKSYKDFIKENVPLFKLLNIKNDINNPMNILIKFTNKWNMLQDKFKEEHLNNTIILTSDDDAGSSNDDDDDDNLINKWSFIKSFFPFEKLKLYYKSNLYYTCFNFYSILFIFIYNKLISKIYDKEKYRNKLMLCARYFNVVYNVFYRYPKFINDNYIKTWINPQNDYKLIVKLIKNLHTEISIFDDFRNRAKDFILINCCDQNIIEHVRWKGRSKLINGYMWKILQTNLSLLIEPIIKKYDDSLYENTTVFNIRGWINENIKKIEQNITKNKDYFDYYQSIIVLWIFSFWLDKKSGLKNVVDSFFVLNLDSSLNNLYRNFFTDYPKIIDLSKNEWAICYNNKILKGNIFIVMDTWIKIIQREKRGRLPIDNTETDFKTIESIISQTQIENSYYDENNNYVDDVSEDLDEIYDRNDELCEILEINNKISVSHVKKNKTFMEKIFELSKKINI